MGKTVDVVVVDVVVTRHAATLQWLEEEAGNYGLDISQARVVPSVSEDDVKGRIVVGNLPMHLASMCSRYFAVEFSSQPPRGQEYGINEMRSCGAHLTEYVVRRA